MYESPWILKRYSTTIRKINSLTKIRKLVCLHKSVDLTPRQWNAIETLLFTINKDLSYKLKSALPLRDLNDQRVVKEISNRIAETEMRLDRAIKIFDTYLDLITQRQAIFLGTMLGGCDVFATSAMKQKHPILQASEPPIVYLERGYGAAILKKSMNFYGYKNPCSLIQIPYSMLATSYMAASVAHEAGHAVMQDIKQEVEFPKMISNTLEEAGAPNHIRDLFILWNRELFADLWAFFCCGTAQAGIRDLLALSDNAVYNINFNDPHPTHYIRVLLSFEWCRQLWGHGIWNDWEQDWLSLYPPKGPKQKYIKTLEEVRQYIPIFSRGIMKSLIPNLKVRFIDLFDMTNLSPYNLKKITQDLDRFKYELKNLNVCHQFAVFRYMYDEEMISGTVCNRLVHKWLRKLNEYKTTVFDI